MNTYGTVKCIKRGHVLSLEESEKGICYKCRAIDAGITQHNGDAEDPRTFFTRATMQIKKAAEANEAALHKARLAPSEEVIPEAPARRARPVPSEERVNEAPLWRPRQSENGEPQERIQRVRQGGKSSFIWLLALVPILVIGLTLLLYFLQK